MKHPDRCLSWRNVDRVTHLKIQQIGQFKNNINNRNILTKYLCGGGWMVERWEYYLNDGAVKKTKLRPNKSHTYEQRGYTVQQSSIFDSTLFFFSVKYSGYSSYRYCFWKQSDSNVFSINPIVKTQTLTHQKRAFTKTSIFTSQTIRVFSFFQAQTIERKK